MPTQVGKLFTFLRQRHEIGKEVGQCNLHFLAALAYQMFLSQVRGTEPTRMGYYILILFSSLSLWETEVEKTSWWEVACDMPYLFPSFPTFWEGPSELGVDTGGEWLPFLVSLLLVAGLAGIGWFPSCDTMSIFLRILSCCCLPVSISRGAWRPSLYLVGCSASLWHIWLSEAVLIRQVQEPGNWQLAFCSLCYFCTPEAARDNVAVLGSVLPAICMMRSSSSPRKNWLRKEFTDGSLPWMSPLVLWVKLICSLSRCLLSAY